ncbi:MAG: nicotinate-nucleotide diphosphorylase (carboxylating), partial [Aeromicrobium sp.]|nr:nicotinate-nucleotide diphosphorylase (carboxylating) [Burkholderiales bacterium]
MSKPAEPTTPEITDHFWHDLEIAVTRDVTLALAEDIGTGDLTAKLIAADKPAVASVMTRVDGVLAGQDWFDRTFTELDPDCEVFWHVT